MKINWPWSKNKLSKMDGLSVQRAQMLRGFFIFFGLLLFVFGGIAVHKTRRVSMERKIKQDELSLGIKVKTAKVKNGSSEKVIALTAETRPYLSGTLYAKISGYLASILVDKGDVVKKGQLLAVIQSTEIDGAVEQSAADEKNKRLILKRSKQLVVKRLVSEQEFDQAQTDWAVANAKLATQKAQQEYEKILAPFDGVITARYADPGALIQSATGSDTSALPIVMVSQLDQLKVDVFVDQKDASMISSHAPVSIFLPEKPDFKMTARVSRTAGELDPRTKMLLVEIDVDNAEHKLIAGSFVQVHLTINTPSYLMVPTEALTFKDNQSFVTVVGEHNQLIYKKVEIANNNGKEVSLLSGIDLKDTVALNIGNSFPEGTLLRPVEGLSLSSEVHK